MNFFGHVLVASWQSGSPAFALGAMLPDFAGMIGGGLAGVDHPDTADGVAWHHATDRAFHALPPVRAHMAQVAAELAALGVGRGPSLGAAHVAVELCLDGALLGRPGADRATALYREALDQAGRPPIGGALRWRPPERQDRWRILLDRLIQRGAPLEYQEPVRVAQRTVQALARRPALALDPAAAAALEHAMPEVSARVAGAAGDILSLLRRALLSR